MKQHGTREIMFNQQDEPTVVVRMVWYIRDESRATGTNDTRNPTVVLGVV
jgi:hypothetical protein